MQALAPDAPSLHTARRLASSSGWSGAGFGGEPHSLWGLCQGSGKTPYQTCVDLTEPAYRCSCPSRKFPCKHALALLLRWASGQVGEGAPPQWVLEWHQARTAREARSSNKGPRTQAQERAVQRRAAQREDRMAGGVLELRQWLSDQVRQGIAGLDTAGYRHFEPLAARLVDAQVPGLAASVRRLATIPSSGEGWEGRLLAELSLLHLLTTAADAQLPAELAAAVKVHIGHPMPSEQVLAGTPVRDVWQIIGVRDSQDDRLTTRRVWLIGQESGREALVLSFAAPGQTLAADLVVGTAIDADLCFYPGISAGCSLEERPSDPDGSALSRRQRGEAAPPSIRALVAARHAARSFDAIGAASVEESLRRLTKALCSDPWLASWPMLLRAHIVPGERWHVVDAQGDALPLDVRCGDQWRFLAASGGAEAVIAAEWGWAGLIPLTMFADGEVVLP